MADTRHVIFRHGNEHSVLAANELTELLKQWGKLTDEGTEKQWGNLTDEGVEELIREGVLEYKPFIGEPMRLSLEYCDCPDPGRHEDLEARLRQCARSGDAAEVRRLLEKGADVDARDNYDHSALWHAANREIVDLLVEAGCTVATVEIVKHASDLDSVVRLLATGIDVNGRDEGGKTILHAASERGNVGLVRHLLAEGADPNAVGRWGGTPIMSAVHPWEDASVDSHLEIVRLLTEAGADVNAQHPPYRGTALMSAAAGGHLELAEALVKAGADVGLVNSHGKTALECAQQAGRQRLVEYLSGAAQGTPSNLLMALRSGQTSLACRIIESGVDPNLEDENGVPIIVWSASAGHADVVESLLVAGANPNAKSKGGDTPLTSAAVHGHASAVRVLLARGADVNLRRPYDNASPISLARWQHHPTVVALLEEAGAHE